MGQIVSITVFLLLGLAIYIIIFFDIDVFKLTRTHSKNIDVVQHEFSENVEIQKNELATTTVINSKNLEIEESNTNTENGVVELQENKNNKIPESIPTTTSNSILKTNTQNELESKAPIIGPEVVIGYVWTSYDGSPRFSSVMVPIFSIDQEHLNDQYSIEIWDGSKFVFYKNTTMLKEVTFPSGGVTKFRVTGISPDLSICPGTRGYTWGIKFVTAGTFKGDQLSITKDVSSEGKTCRIIY